MLTIEVPHIGATARSRSTACPGVSTGAMTIRC
jgi:hypothetical protein